MGAAWPKNTFAVKATQTSTNVPVWITNMNSFTVRPIRVAENMTASVSVNGGSAPVLTPPTVAPFALGPNLGTNDAVFVWTHAKLTRGDSVTVTACAVNVPGNIAYPSCWSRTVAVS